MKEEQRVLCIFFSWLCMPKVSCPEHKFMPLPKQARRTSTKQMMASMLWALRGLQDCSSPGIWPGHWLLWWQRILTFQCRWRFTFLWKGLRMESQSKVYFCHMKCSHIFFRKLGHGKAVSESWGMAKLYLAWCHQADIFLDQFWRPSMLSRSSFAQHTRLQVQHHSNCNAWWWMPCTGGGQNMVQMRPLF